MGYMCVYHMINLQIIIDNVLFLSCHICKFLVYEIPSRHCKLEFLFLSLSFSDNDSILFFRQCKHVLILFLSCTSNQRKGCCAAT